MEMIGACTILTDWVSRIMKRNRQRQPRRPVQNRPRQRLDLLQSLRPLRRPLRPPARERLRRRRRIRRQTFRQPGLRSKDEGNDEESRRYQTCSDTGGSDVGRNLWIASTSLLPKTRSEEHTSELQ